MTKTALWGLVALCVCSFASTVKANEKGNGGDVVVCSGGATTLLDRFEAEQLRGISFDETLLGVDALATSANIIQRIAAVDQFRAELYQARLNTFMSEARFINNAGLIDIPDSAHISIPAGCEIKQIAVQRVPKFPQDPYYVIDNTLWEALSVKDQAGLIMHEIIYREAISRSHSEPSCMVSVYGDVCFVESASHRNLKVSCRYFDLRSDRGDYDLNARYSAPRRAHFGCHEQQP